MKKLFFVMVVLFFVGFNSNAQTVIGKVENGVGKITINESVLKEKWESYLKLNKIEDANLSDFVIKKSDIGTYYIIAHDNTIRNGVTNKYGIVLTADDLKLSALGSTCICSGCSDGCGPELKGKYWICNPCTDSKSSCNKTETATSENIVF